MTNNSDDTYSNNSPSNPAKIEGVIPVDTPVRARSRSRFSKVPKKVLKASVGIVLIAALGWLPAKRIFEVSSTEAVINARVNVLRSPIQGTVKLSRDRVAMGDIVNEGGTIFRVINDRADRTSLTSAEREVSQLNADKKAIEIQLNRLDKMADRVSIQFNDFIVNREEVLKLRIESKEAQLASAKAEHDLATTALKRAQTLAVQGVSSQTTLDNLLNRETVARNAIVSAQSELNADQAELAALRKRSFIGDGYNDIPRTAQRLDEIEMQRVMAQADLDKINQRLGVANETLLREKTNFDLRQEAVVTAPKSGQIWEMLASPGETINQGQEVMKVLDCSTILVTSLVDENTFNELNLGMRVVFHTSSTSSEKYLGTVVQLAGGAVSDNNFAIKLIRTGDKMQYRVIATLDRPDASAASCPIGQTGRLVFKDEN